jgi:hypothetical protein
MKSAMQYSGIGADNGVRTNAEFDKLRSFGKRAAPMRAFWEFLDQYAPLFTAGLLMLWIWLMRKTR